MSAVYRRTAAAFAAVVASSFFLAELAPPAAARERVAFNGGVSPGTIVVRTSERKLYLVLGEGQALRYPVGVGRSGRQWAGRSYIDGKYVRPAWAPPPEIRKDKPNLPNMIPGGSPQNPMGAAALTLSGGGNYAIHGTNNPGSIGGFVSYGCIRMYNQDIVDLYQRVSVGTPVIVTR
jgi:lipoprotein-anchoring transpeptidase ErfK/SrfK